MNKVLPIIQKRNVDGFLILDKPSGITSNAALQKVKRLFRAKKAGHCGSLDPLASGLLPICLGEATKFSRFLLEADKHYEVTAKLGVRTQSGDAESEVLLTRPLPFLSEEILETHLEKFRGSQQQIPPMFSAIKLQGQPLYKLARQGKEVPRAARAIQVYTLRLISLERDGELLTLEVKASKGTYVRSLVDDLGESLGCGAHIVALRRLGSGPFKADQMVRLDELNGLGQDDPKCVALDAKLLPLDSAISNWPILQISAAASFYIKQGQALALPYSPNQGWVRLFEGDVFIGIGEILEDGRVAPKRLRAG